MVVIDIMLLNIKTNLKDGYRLFRSRSKEKAPTLSTALRSGIADMKSRDVDKSAPFIQH